MKNLNGKVAFVTGGASGIGLGMVRNFLAEGMKVVAADFNDDHLAEAKDLLAGSNAVHFLKVDVSDRDQLRDAAQETLNLFGKIHVLCNNAGVGSGGTVDDPDFEDWDRAISINLGGVVNGVKIIAPIIKAQGEGGHIVNTSSAAGLVPLPGMGAYATSKYAVRGLTDSLRMSLAPAGIGVSCLFPGLTRSRIVDLPDRDETGGAEDETIAMFRAAMDAAMDPMEVGAAVVRGIRDNARFIATHREFLDEIRELHQEIEAAFPSEQEVPDARQAFEDSRRGQTEHLLKMPTKD